MTPALLGNLGVSLALAFSLLGLGLALLAYLQGDGRFLRGRGPSCFLPSSLRLPPSSPWSGPFSSTTSAWPTWRGTTPPRTPSG